MADRKTCDTKKRQYLYLIQESEIVYCWLKNLRVMWKVYELSWVVYTRQNDRKVTSSFQNTEQVQLQYINTGHNYFTSWTINLQMVVLFKDLGRDGHSRFVYSRNGWRSLWSRKNKKKLLHSLSFVNLKCLRLPPTSRNCFIHLWGFRGVYSSPCVIPFCWFITHSQCLNRCLNFEAAYCFHFQGMKWL